MLCLRGMPIFAVNGRLWAARWGMVVAVLSLLPACDLLEPDETRTFHDQGKICLFPEGAKADNPFGAPTMSVTFPADRALSITVMAPTCLSSTCSKDEKAQCSATVKGNVIAVTSSASVREEKGVGAVCTDDCGALVARCTTPPLPAGTYQVQHGPERLTVTIPSSTLPPCAGKAP